MEGVENGSLMDLNLSDAMVSLNQPRTIYKNSLPIISISPNETQRESKNGNGEKGGR